MLIWLAACYLFFLIFVQLGFFRSFQKIIIRNSNLTPVFVATACHTAILFCTVVHSVTTSFCTPWISFCLFPCAKKYFYFFFLIIIFTSCGWRMCWIMYWWLQTIRNTIFFLLKTIWENVSSSVCYAQVLFLSFAFQKMYVNIYMENNEATPTISDKWCFVKML